MDLTINLWVLGVGEGGIVVVVGGVGIGVEVSSVEVVAMWFAAIGSGW